MHVVTQASTYAVLMGDLVKSERSEAPSDLHVRFNQAIERQNHARRKLLASPLTITLGDEFQSLVTSFTVAAAIARDIRLELLNAGIDCRFALGAARLTTPLNTQRAWNMMGPGLSATRERLNEKKSNSLYRFVVPEDPVLETLLEASGATLTSIERKWSDVQRRDITALLEGEDVNAIAKRRNVSVHNIYKVRASGDYDLYVIQWHAVHEALAALDRKFEMKGAG